MPGFNGRGPRGEGPMTGGGFGYCNPDRTGYGRPAAQGIGRGRGLRRDLGQARGFGRGFGRRSSLQSRGGRYGPDGGRSYNVNPGEEVEMRRNEADTLRGEIATITRRIEALEVKQ